MKRLSLMVDFVSRIYDLTGEPPDRDDLRIFNSPGWVHIIQRNPDPGSHHQHRVGWCTYKTLGQHLPRTIGEKWAEN